MCVRVRCANCEKPTWSGCGAHIEQALAGVAAPLRCRCREEELLAKTAREKLGRALEQLE
jgi:hypothetical protein